jgi:anti-sigma B factor antagonist
MPDRGAPLERLVVDVETAADGATASVRLQGDLDLATAPALQHRLEALLGDPVRTLVLDMSAVPFCDVPALNVLLRIQTRLAERGGHLVLLGAARSLRMMVAVLGLGSRLRLVPAPGVAPPGDDRAVSGDCSAGDEGIPQPDQDTV